jgi:3-oxoacyl-[acyl-carrier-protein] synthase II
MTPVAITGIGLLSPLGLGPEANLEGLLAGRSGLSAPTGDQVRAMGVPGVGAVDLADRPGLDRVESLALAAARGALADAGLEARELQERTYLAVSTSKGAVASIETQLADRAAPRLPLERLAASSAGAVVARELGIRGPVVCFPAACATGLVSVLAAAREVASGRAERLTSPTGPASTASRAWPWPGPARPR